MTNDGMTNDESMAHAECRMSEGTLAPSGSSIRHSSFRHSALLLLAVFGLALALRLAWVGAIEWRGGALFGPDAPSYDALATNLLAGNGLQMQAWAGLFRDPQETVTVHAFRPPLLPIVLAGIYGVFGHHFWAARVAMALLSAATCVVVLRIAHRLFGTTTAAVTGFLMAIYPKFIYYGGEPVTETLCTLMLALAVSVLLAAYDAGRGAAEDPGCHAQVPAWACREQDARSSKSLSVAPSGGWRWLAGGALLALAALSRSSLLAFPGAAALWVILARRNKTRAVAEAALLLIGFVLVMTPWWIRNFRVFGHIVPATTEGGYTLWVTNNERATGGGHCFMPEPPGEFEGLNEHEIDRTFQRNGAQYIREHPDHFLRLAAAKFLRFWRLWPHADEPSVGLPAAILAGLSFTPILLLALWGAIVTRARWRALLLLYLLFLYYTSLHMVFMAITRYRVPIEPYLIVLAAAALVDLHSRVTRRMDNGR